LDALKCGSGSTVDVIKKGVNGRSFARFFI